MVLPHQLQALFDNSLDGILISEPGGAIHAANPAACRLLGRSQEEIVRVGRGGLVDRDDPRVGQGVVERATTGRFFGELTMIRGDGSRFPAEVSSVVYDDVHGHARAFVIFRDVTERHRTRAELSTGYENLTAIIENSPIAMQGLTAESRTIFWNKAAERLFGWTASEVIGGLNPIVGPQHASEYAALSGRALAGHVLSGVEVQRLHKDGTIIDLSLSTSVIKSVDGELIALIGVYEDLRPRKAAERARIREEQVAAMRELAVGVRHEMNNTLAALRMEVEFLLQGENLPPEERASAAATVQQVDRLAAALRRLDHVEELQSVPYVDGQRMLDISERR